jgi:hypothetical protein
MVEGSRSGHTIDGLDTMLKPAYGLGLIIEGRKQVDSWITLIEGEDREPAPTLPPLLA